MRRTELDEGRFDSLLREVHDQIPREAVVWFRETVLRLHGKRRPFSKARLRLRGMGCNDEGILVLLEPSDGILHLCTGQFERDTSYSEGWSILGDFHHPEEAFDDVIDIFGDRNTDVYIDYRFSDPVEGSRLQACPGPGGLKRISERFWKSAQLDWTNCDYLVAA